MGVNCCKFRSSFRPTIFDTSHGEEADGEHLLLDPLGPRENLGFLEERPTILLLGPQGAGKTVLFVRLVYPGIPVDDAVGIVSETSTFHVERAIFGGRECTLWDISGREAFTDAAITGLSTCHVRGIIWVVSMLDVKPERVAQIQRQIHRTIHNVIFHAGFFALLFNTYDLYADEAAPEQLTEHGKQTLQFLLRSYGVNRLMLQYPTRFTWVVGSVREGMQDHRLAELSTWAHNFFVTQ